MEHHKKSKKLGRKSEPAPDWVNETIASVDATEAAKQELTRIRAEKQRSKQLAASEHHKKILTEEVERLEELLGIALDLRGRTESYKPLVIKRRETNAIREGTGVLLVSDLHPEEIVSADTVSGLNEFSPEIAQQRIENLIIGTRWMLDAARAKEKRAGYKIRDFMLCILGDLISNSIHPDLAESNALGPADATIFVFNLIQAVIDSLLADKEIERLIIPCAMGNHDRLTHKNRHQTKAETSLATIIYAMLQRLYRDQPRVEFQIARGNMLYVNAYGKLVRGTHGDDIRYNGGTGGIHIPLRKAIDAWNRAHDAALTVCGHWHQALMGPDYVVNGSLIGYTAFAQAIKARFEPAAQVFFVLDPRSGKRMFSPIQVQECENHWS